MEGLKRVYGVSRQTGRQLVGVVFTGRGWTFLIVVDSPSLEAAPKFVKKHKWNHAAYYQEDKD